MVDREKVIRQWEGIIDQIKQGNMRRPIATTLVYDTIDLLREQEPVKPIFDEEDVSGRCGVCGHALTHQSMVGDVLVDEWFQYCPNCGRKVKWDDRD